MSDANWSLGIAIIGIWTGFLIVRSCYRKYKKHTFHRFFRDHFSELKREEKIEICYAIHGRWLEKSADRLEYAKKIPDLENFTDKRLEEEFDKEILEFTENCDWRGYNFDLLYFHFGRLFGGKDGFSKTAKYYRARIE